MEEIIRLEHAVKEYDDGYKKTIKALDIEDLRINNGEFIVVLGRSGSGKSTLLNVIGTQCELTSGDVYYKEQSYKKMKDKERASLRAGMYSKAIVLCLIIPFIRIVNWR